MHTTTAPVFPGHHLTPTFNGKGTPPLGRGYVSFNNQQLRFSKSQECISPHHRYRGWPPFVLVGFVDAFEEAVCTSPAW